MNIVVVGAQWGDEGKGKIIDILSKDVDVVVRYQGGNNAGHTVIKECGEFVLHLIPSGIFHPKVKCVIGNGVVVDPEALISEIKELESKKISVKGRLFVSDRAHLIFPYHRAYDRLREDKEGFTKIGTTGRGIGPSYGDKVMRCGIRVADLYDEPAFREKLTRTLREKNEVLQKIFGRKSFSFKEIYDQYLEYGRLMKPYVQDTAVLLNQAVKAKKKIMFEGAQGTHLDVDHGTYPYVTSSYVTAGGASVGTGVPPNAIDKVVGVVKAYTTRVGEGPFPTEFDTKLMEEIRKKGKEFGATTGRPRRCGWFDAVLVKYACMINGLNEIAVTKLDVLDDLSQIKICVGYRFGGKLYRDFPASLTVQQKAVPVYETHAGWRQDTSGVKQYAQLPVNAKKYLKRLTELLDVPISLLSVGSHEKQTLRLSQSARRVR